MNEPCIPLWRGLLIPCRGDAVFGCQEKPVSFKIITVALVSVLGLLSCVPSQFAPGSNLYSVWCWPYVIGEETSIAWAWGWRKLISEVTGT